MRAKHFFGMILAGTALSAVAVGCGSSSDDTSDTSGTTTSGAGGGASTSTTTGGTGGAGGAGGGQSSSVTTTTGGSTTGDNDNSMADASDYELASSTVQGSGLADGEFSPVGDVDYYKFTGTKGQAVGLIVASQDLENAAFDPTFPDTILTLLSADGTEIALNDDPDPRFSNDSSLFTLLPADGDYYVTVQECWTYKNSHPENTAIGCADPEDKPNTAYQFFGYSIEPTDSVTRNEEKGNDAASATAMTYGQNTSGQYYISQVFGTFSSETDVDVFAFTPPDQTVQNGRPTTYWDVMMPGMPGNGSTTTPGKMYITTAADPSVRLAEVDGKLTPSLAPPLALGQDYLLFVEHPGTAAGANDFYFLQHYVGSSNNLEAEGDAATGANDTWAGAESLTASTSSSATSTYYFFEGDLPPSGSGMDVDYVKFAVPAGMTQMKAGCVANYVGSGLTGLNIDLLQGDGTTSLGTGTEDATAATPTDAGVYSVAIPAGTTELGLKVTAASQGPVLGKFYRCGVTMVAQ